MSITVDYFFNSDSDLDRLASDMKIWIGTNLKPYDGDPKDLFCRFLGIEFDLGEHHLSNDSDCNFEDYKYQVGTRTPAGDGDLRDIQVETVAMVAFSLFRRLKVNSGLLVFDAQSALARYEVIEGHWYDQISEKRVEFPDHFQVLQSRITRDGWR